MDFGQRIVEHAYFGAQPAFSVAAATAPVRDEPCMNGVGTTRAIRRDRHEIGSRAHVCFNAEVAALAPVVIGREVRPVAVGESTDSVRVSGGVNRQRARSRRADAEHVDVVGVVQPPLPRFTQSEIGRFRAGVAVVVAVSRHVASVVVARGDGDVEVGGGSPSASVLPPLQICIAATGGDAELA